MTTTGNFSSKGAGARAPKRGSGGRGAGGPKTIASALGAMFEELGIAQTVRTYNVITSWPDVVGEQIAKVTVAQRIERGILYVSVRSAPWRTELTMQRREIIRKINEAARNAVVIDIRFR